MAGSMARRPGLPIRRPPESALFSSATAVPIKSRVSPLVSLCFLLVVSTCGRLLQRLIGFNFVHTFETLSDVVEERLL